MRIIAGQARGRRLAVPPGRSTRPSSDRMREALFSSILASEGPLDGSRFLDLYAGSAAIAIEAWSRGAAHVLAIESDERAGRVARANIASCGARGAVVLRSGSVDRVLAESPGAPYDVVFADPPYELATPRLQQVLSTASATGWLGEDTLVVVERASRDAGFQWPPVVEPLRERSYGAGTLWYGRARPHDVSSGTG